jgi:hypothetical protein
MSGRTETITVSSEPETATCPSCGAAVGEHQHYCTRCGISIPDAAPPVPTPSGDGGAEGAEVLQRGRFSTRSKVALGVSILVLVGLAVGNIYFGTQLSSANDEIASLEDDNADLQRGLAFTRAELKSAQALSTQRKRVLENTKRVVKQVDPVLSSADTMQLLTAQMQEEQASFAANSDLTIGYLAELVEYLGTTDPYYYSISFITSMLDEAVAYFDASRTDEEDLASLSSRYKDASKRFENKATKYTLAVERLEKQLSSATK